MRYSTFQDILCADACLVFIVTGIICAALRWFHMCRPYNREENYFYPARKEVALTYLLLSLIQIPYFLAPSDDAVIKIYRARRNTVLPDVFLCSLRHLFRRTAS